MPARPVASSAIEIGSGVTVVGMVVSGIVGPVGGRNVGVGAGGAK
jgi:hypothetical protein